MSKAKTHARHVQLNNPMTTTFDKKMEQSSPHKKVLSESFQRFGYPVLPSYGHPKKDP